MGIQEYGYVHIDVKDEEEMKFEFRKGSSKRKVLDKFKLKNKYFKELGCAHDVE